MLGSNANAVYSRFNYKYNNAPLPNSRQPSPVSYAIFHQAYQHAAINGINYALPMIYSPCLMGFNANEILIG